MSYNTPIQFEVPSPTHLDAKISEIQSVLKTAKLSWNQYSFARAYRFAKVVDGVKVYYPAVYQSTTSDYLNVFPNDNLSSYSFVYAQQPQTFIGENVGFHNYMADLSVIVVFRLSAIGTANAYRFTELLKYDVIEQLYKVSDLEVNQVYDHIEDCFEAFSVNELEFEYLSEQWGGLRFDCSVRYETNCKLTNTY